MKFLFQISVLFYSKNEYKLPRYFDVITSNTKNFLEKQNIHQRAKRLKVLEVKGSSEIQQDRQPVLKFESTDSF